MAEKMQKGNGERRLCMQMKVQGMGRYHRRLKLHSREDVMQKITDMLSKTSIDTSHATHVRHRSLDKQSAVPRCIPESPQALDLIKDESFIIAENEQLCELNLSLEQMSIDTCPE